jgi:outer membrane protein OmpA-like peptidoglycan-associated protein
MDWTEGLLTKRRVEIDERFHKVETDAGAQRDRIDQVETRLARLDTRVTETREMIRTVSTQTASATGTRGSLSEPRAPLGGSERTAHSTRTLVAVVHVLFGFDRADLDPAAEAAVASILKELRDNPNFTIDLEGSTDPVGSLDYNVRLSQRRVEAVKRWLLKHGVGSPRIVDAKARGPLENASVKDDLKRRVMVKLMSLEE